MLTKISHLTLQSLSILIITFNSITICKSERPGFPGNAINATVVIIPDLNLTGLAPSDFHNPLSYFYTEQCQRTNCDQDGDGIPDFIILNESTPSAHTRYIDNCGFLNINNEQPLFWCNQPNALSLRCKNPNQADYDRDGVGDNCDNVK